MLIRIDFWWEVLRIHPTAYQSIQKSVLTPTSSCLFLSETAVGGVGSLPFLYWITVVYMNYTRPYGNLSQFVRGKTSFLPRQSEEKQVRARAYRVHMPVFIDTSYYILPIY